MLHFVISGKMLRHYLALICNLTTKFRVWVVLCHGAFCFKKEFIDSCLNNEKCILHLPEFIFNDNKNLLALDTDTSDRIKAVKNFLAVLSDSICSLFIVNSNVASISLGNESFSTDEDLEYGYLINTGNHYDVYLPPELFAQAYKLNNKEMNAQLDYLNRYAI